MISQLSQILNCSDNYLLEKIEQAIGNFNKLDLSLKYSINFSGGKDSHALLIIFLLWKKLYNIDTNNFIILFSDTRLETPLLYSLVNNIENRQDEMGVTFKRVFPKKSYWYYQFGLGYNVPDWRVRWCTTRLKVLPIASVKGYIPLTGRHYGESQLRDGKLLSSNNSSSNSNGDNSSSNDSGNNDGNGNNNSNSSNSNNSSNCSSGECGVDKIKFTLDPIIHFRNCEIWDLIFYADGNILYSGVFNFLQNTYNGATNDSGSLRMGCLMCPVISFNTLRKNNSKDGLYLRMILEKLREARRLINPKTKKLGSIYIEDRRIIWESLDKELLIKLGYITLDEIQEIDDMIKNNTYPKIYSKEWIESEHLRLQSMTIYTDLPLFNLV